MHNFCYLPFLLQFDRWLRVFYVLMCNSWAVGFSAGSKTTAFESPQTFEILSDVAFFYYFHNTSVIDKSSLLQISLYVNYMPPLLVAKQEWFFRNFSNILWSLLLHTTISFVHGLRTPRDSFFSKIRNFWAWADKLC